MRVEREGIREIRWWMTGILLVLCCIIPAVSARAAVKNIRMTDLEKKVTAVSTRKIQYRPGSVYSAKNKWWRSAKTISLGTKTLRFSRKGRVTFRITNTKGRKQLFFAKIKKKVYRVKANQPLTEEEACLYLTPAAQSPRVLEVPGGTCRNGDRVASAAKGEGAWQQWMLEPVTKTKFRLKNVNSGLYLTAVKDGGSSRYRLEQRTLDTSDRAFSFEAVYASEKYVYIKNAAGAWMHAGTGTPVCRERKNARKWRFRLAETKPAVSDMTASGYTYPTSLVMGTAFSLKGIVQSRYAMASLTAAVVREKDNQIFLQKTAAPGQSRYDLSGVDAAIRFGSLAVGNYFYRVTAKDVKGVVKTVINRRFSVYIPSGTGTKTLRYDPLLIQAIGYQSDGTALEKKACASFALAYCQAILTGRAVAPQTFWSGAANVDCVWSRGGYTTVSAGSEAAVLQNAYAQLSAGKPCILHVYSSTSSQHWLTLVGYKNVTSTAYLSTSNFLAIDPWDGTLITVSDRYKTKNTYRLAVPA